MFEALLSSLLLSAAAAHPPTGDVADRYGRWERRLRARVERLHVVPSEAHQVERCDVAVSFVIDGDGRASDAKVGRSSCSSFYDRQALGLVRELGRIGAVPSVDARHRRVFLKLSYGTATGADADRQITQSLEAERAVYARRNVATIMAASTTPLASIPGSGE